MGRDGRHGLTALEQERQRGKVGGRGADSPTQAKPGQPFVGDADETTRRHQQVFTGHERLQAEGLLALRQARRVQEASVIAFAQHLTAEQSLGETARCDRQVKVALHQGPADDLTVGLAENQAQARRAVGHFFDQASPMGNFEIVRQADDDRAAFVMAGIRVDHRQALAAFIQCFADHRLQLIGLQRRRQAPAGAHE